MPEPNRVATVPPAAGPTARARLNATAPSASALFNSSRETNTLTLACCAGM